MQNQGKNIEIQLLIFEILKTFLKMKSLSSIVISSFFIKKVPNIRL